MRKGVDAMKTGFIVGGGIIIGLGLGVFLHHRECVKILTEIQDEVMLNNAGIKTLQHSVFPISFL